MIVTVFKSWFNISSISYTSELRDSFEGVYKKITIELGLSDRGLKAEIFLIVKF